MHLGWNVSIPVASRHEFGTAAFAGKLRGALAKLAEALEPLLAHRKGKG